MDLTFNTALIQGYKSPAQIARRLTEDYVCQNCRAQYELKSKKSSTE